MNVHAFVWSWETVKSLASGIKMEEWTSAGYQTCLDSTDKFWRSAFLKIKPDLYQKGQDQNLSRGKVFWMFCFLSEMDRNIPESRVDEMNQSTNQVEKRN